MSTSVWNFVVCALMIAKSTFAIPLQFYDDELSKFDIIDPETSEIPPEIDDTIDMFSFDKDPNGTEDTMPGCKNSDSEVELNAEELQVNNFNSDFTSQEIVPNETETKEVENLAEIKQKEITSDQKSKNDEILSKIETAILKSRSNDDDSNNIVMPVPEFVPIFKPRGSEAVNKNCDAKDNVKVQPTAPASACTNSANPTINKDNKFIITGLYLKHLNDLGFNPNTIDSVTKGPMQNAISTGCPTNMIIANGNVNPDVLCGFSSANQNPISSNNIIPDIFTSLPNSNLGHVNLGTPTQKQIDVMNPNQDISNTQTVLCNAAPCPRHRVLNTQNHILLQNSNLFKTNSLSANPNVLLNPTLTYNPNRNTIISNQATACKDNLQLLKSHTISANGIRPTNFKDTNKNMNAANQIPYSNLKWNAGKPIQIISQNLAPGKVLPNALTSIRNKPLFLFMPETLTRHEVCGDILKKKTYTVLVPFQVSKIA